MPVVAVASFLVTMAKAGCWHVDGGDVTTTPWNIMALSHH